MSNDIVQTGNAPVPFNPFPSRAVAAHVNAGTVDIESSRAIAEAQGKMIMAKRFPRDENMAFAKAMESCKRLSLASLAFYSYPKGGQTVTGPTIRLAEELARCWGNIEYGIRELSRKDGVSEMQAFAIDLESTVYSTQNFTVRHIRDTRGGGKDLTDERDIYELTANMGGRRLRARILAILPPDLKEAAIEMCKKTIASGGGDVPLADRVKRMVTAFEKVGVTPQMLAKHLNHPLDQTNAEELADLHGIYSALKDGAARIDDFFGEKPAIPEGGGDADGAADKPAENAQPAGTDAPPANKQRTGLRGALNQGKRQQQNAAENTQEGAAKATNEEPATPVATPAPAKSRAAAQTPSPAPAEPENAPVPDNTPDDPTAGNESGVEPEDGKDLF